MLIKELELKDIGPHKHIKVENIGAVVGILGINGTGKSNILHALEALLTGDWPDNNSSYVRNCNLSIAPGEDGKVDQNIKPNNGSARIVFTHQGQEYESFRQEGATKKMTLRVGDNAPITKVQEIRRQLGTIFRADTRLLSTAVFPRQGSIDKILLGTKTEREDFYIKLLNLEYCIQRSKIVEARITTLLSGITDLKSFIQEADDNRRAAEEQANALQGQLSSTPDVAADFAAALAWRTAFNMVKGSESRMNIAQQQRDAAFQDLGALISSFGGKTAGEISTLADKEEADLGKLKDQRGESQVMWDKLAARDTTSSALDTAAKAHKDDTNARWFAYPGNTSDCATKLQQARSCLQGHQVRAKADIQLNNLLGSLNKVLEAQNAALAYRMSLSKLPVSECRARRQILIDELATYKAWLEHSYLLAQARTKLAASKASFDSIGTAQHSSNIIELAEINDRRRELETWIKQLTSALVLCRELYKHAMDCGLKVNVPCAHCGLTISAIPADTLADLNDRERSIESYKRELADISHRQKALDAAIATFTKTHAELQAAYTRELTEVQRLESHPMTTGNPSRDTKAIEAEIAAIPDPELLQATENNIAKLNSERAVIEANIQGIQVLFNQKLELTLEEATAEESKLAQLLPRLQELDNKLQESGKILHSAKAAYAPYTDLPYTWETFKARTPVADLDVVIAKSTQGIKQLRDKAALVSQKTTVYTMREQTFTVAYGEHLAATANYEEHKNRVCQTELAKSLWVSFNPMSDLDFEQKVVTLQTAQQERSALEGRTQQAWSVMQGHSTRVQELRKAQEANTKKETLAEELRAVKDLLARDGLPLLYVRKCFSILAKETDRYLRMLDTNFVVRQDTQDSCNFEFRRTDQDIDSWLPMVKLSGGQKVRLGIAFLLAVQRNLVPDVGLLVLDEPSNHLDQEGVESLCTLLGNLGNLFAGAGLQIWVVDHRPELESAFNTKIKLIK